MGTQAKLSVGDGAHFERPLCHGLCVGVHHMLCECGVLGLLDCSDVLRLLYASRQSALQRVLVCVRSEGVGHAHRIMRSFLLAVYGSSWGKSSQPASIAWSAN